MISFMKKCSLVMYILEVMIINPLFYDENLMSLSGKTLIAAEVGEKYGVKDVDSNKPKSDREVLGGPRDFSDAVVY